MRLPDDEHVGWDKLIAAVLDDGDEDVTESARPSEVASSSADDLVALLDLAGLQPRAAVGAADGDQA